MSCGMNSDNPLSTGGYTGLITASACAPLGQTAHPGREWSQWVLLLERLRATLAGKQRTPQEASSANVHCSPQFRVDKYLPPNRLPRDGRGRSYLRPSQAASRLFAALESILHQRRCTGLRYMTLRAVIAGAYDIFLHFVT